MVAVLRVRLVLVVQLDQQDLRSLARLDPWVLPALQDRNLLSRDRPARLAQPGRRQPLRGQQALLGQLAQSAFLLLARQGLPALRA